MVLVVTFTALFSASGMLIWAPILFNAFLLYMSAPELVVIFLLFGLSFVQAVVAYGLWTVQKWGRDLARYVFAFGYVLSLVSIWALEHLMKAGRSKPMCILMAGGLPIFCGSIRCLRSMIISS